MVDVGKAAKALIAAFGPHLEAATLAGIPQHLYPNDYWLKLSGAFAWTWSALPVSFNDMIKTLRHGRTGRSSSQSLRWSLAAGSAAVGRLEGDNRSR